MLYTYIEFDESKVPFYEELISGYDDWEQSILWQCMNDKLLPKFHENLNEVISSRLSRAPDELYRGISHSTLRQIQDLDIGDTFNTGHRVTSFTTDFAMARQFAGTYVYETRTILKLIDAPKAFNFQQEMINMLLAAPESEFRPRSSPFGTTDRGDKLDMVNREDEWMIPAGSELIILDQTAIDSIYTQVTVMIESKRP
ncbi:RNA polymerase ADP-ribosylase [Escherichia phage EcS1]|uniref:NAD--protein ADP-ribosyltransferase modB n=1 Tax=Escherichia phage EcS1 TaxID=2083276 RepID=A0A2Z5ZC75_9CAUD|nr:RNA polymerase ADP-ribosylase [Escherichia phage EcS1]BBC78067.1 ADP-rybosylase [Escherichia phage EcS1]